MILYNLDYYPYYIPEQYLDSNDKKDEIISDENKNKITDDNNVVNKINNDTQLMKKYYKITKKCIIGGTIGFYLGLISNNIVYYSLIGGSLGYLYSYLPTIKRN
jgi:hypothetical protein